MRFRLLSAVAGVSLLATPATEGSFTGFEGHLAHDDVQIGADAWDAWQVYALFDNPSDTLTVVSGNTAHPVVIYTEGSFYQDPMGSVIEHDPALEALFPDLVYDTFVTLGGFGGGPTTQTQGVEAGFGDGVLALPNGVWFRVPGDPLTEQVATPGGNSGVLIGQFTVPAGDSLIGVVRLSSNNIDGMGVTLIDQVFAFGGTGDGDCCAQNATPGCTDPLCTAVVCAANPFCCDAEWDATCSALSAGLCIDCVDRGDCCGANGTPGCDDPDCVALVCEVNPFCCSTSWDAGCADLAGELCIPCGAPGDCCTVTDAAGCQNSACLGLVCSLDPACCDIAWSQPCVDLAISLCQTCGATPGDCCVEGVRPGCDDPVCATMVCMVDPTCCMTAWSATCTELALSLCATCDPELCNCCDGDLGVPGCSSASCESVVCATDQFCCEVSWDTACAGLAEALCSCCENLLECEQVTAPPCITMAGCQFPDQSGHGSAATVGAVSDMNPIAGLIVADNFSPAVSGAITSVCWWGFYVDLGGPVQCAPGPDDFTITYFNDDAGGLLPGTVRAGPFAVGDGSGGCTGLSISSGIGPLVEYQYTVTHEPVAVEAGGCYWIQIANSTTGACLWHWSTAPPGDGRGAQDDEPTDYDQAFCISLPTAPAACTVSDPCDGAAGDCFEPHAQPGCNDPECCGLVCDTTPICCQITWDSTCVLAAQTLCQDPTDVCNGGISGPCCIETGTLGCDDPTCCTIVCGLDPFCCNVAWDGICADSAQVNCPGTCSGNGGGGGVSDCCIPNGGLGCDDEGCQALICGADPFCCDVEWDQICADLANEQCFVCAAGGGGGGGGTPPTVACGVVLLDDGIDRSGMDDDDSSDDAPAPLLAIDVQVDDANATLAISIDIGCTQIEVENGQLVELHCDTDDAPGGDDPSSDDDSGDDSSSGSDDDGSSDDSDSETDDLTFGLAAEPESTNAIAPVRAARRGDAGPGSIVGGPGGSAATSCDFAFVGDVLVIHAETALLVATAANDDGGSTCTLDLCDPSQPQELGYICVEDISGDGMVNEADLQSLQSSWGDVPADHPADFNRDRRVDTDDLTRLLTCWGPC